MKTTHNLASSPATKDSTALWLGIAFSLALTALIWALGSRLDRFPLLPDQGAAWYYWKLPSPTFWSRASAWGLYLLHQFALWGLIFYAQRRRLSYTNRLHSVNVVALGLNAIFIVLHLLQTHLWYDGLAQDVSIFSSQASVVVLLIWVLLMENPRRGLFWGKKVPISKQIIAWARKYHGYFFSWAIVYTFWFHHMVATSGHLIGFFYMFLLMVQGSLFFTRVHLNRWWTTTLEVTVLAHGTLVAIMTGNNLWPMFAFGFGGIFVITQMHGLGLSRLGRGAILALYAGLVLWVYSQRGWDKLNEIVRIPVIDYLGVLVLAGLIALGLAIARRLRPAQSITMMQE